MRVGDVCVWSSYCGEWETLDVQVGDVAGIVIEIVISAITSLPVRYKILEPDGELGSYSNIFLEKVNEKR